MICEWPNLQRGAACIHCGYVLKRDYPDSPMRPCTVGSEAQPAVWSGLNCPRLLDTTGEYVALKNCGCGAMTAVYECELYKLCAPVPRTKDAEILGRDDVRLCLNCEMNPANQSGNST